MNTPKPEHGEGGIDDPNAANALHPALNAISTRLEQAGTLKYLRRPERPSRLIVGVKQDHGSVAEHKKWMAEGNIAALQRWLAHQNEIVRIGMDLEAAHPGGMHYLIEIYRDGQGIPQDVPALRAQQEAIFTRGAQEERVARNIALAVTDQPNPTSEVYMQNQMGMFRLMLALVANHPQAAKRIHGLNYPERAAYVQLRKALAQLGNIPGLQNGAEADFRRVNSIVSQHLQNQVPSGHCALIVLGGNHFHTGANISQLLRYDDTPRNIEQIMLDTQLLRSPAFANDAIAVLQPRNYPE